MHYTACPSCRRVADDLLYAENRLAFALSEIAPTSRPEMIAATAISESDFRRRRRIARVVRAVLSTSAVALLVTALVQLRDRRAGDSRITETVTLSCITAAQAASIASPYLRSDGSSVVIHDEGLSTITLRGVIDEVVAAKINIDEVDASGRCATSVGGSGTNAPVTSGTPVPDEVAKPNPPDDKQGKD